MQGESMSSTRVDRKSTVVVTNQESRSLSSSNSEVIQTTLDSSICFSPHMPVSVSHMCYVRYSRIVPSVPLGFVTEIIQTGPRFPNTISILSGQLRAP